MRKLCIVLVIATLISSCNSKKKEDTVETAVKDSTTVSTEKSTAAKVDVYEGLLPCADCSGIETVLKIYQGDGTMESHKFELFTVYKGKSPEKEFIEKGTFNTERGLENDPNGTIYVLNWDKPAENQIYYGYYSADPEKVYMLDREKKIIKSELNYALTLKK